MAAAKAQAIPKAHKPALAVKPAAAVKPLAMAKPVAPAVAAKPTLKAVTPTPASPKPPASVNLKTKAAEAAPTTSNITFSMPPAQQSGSPTIAGVEPLIEATAQSTEPAGVVPMLIPQGCTRIRQVGVVGDMQAAVIESAPVGSNDCMYP
jgi:hypothetical protein